MTVPTPAVNVPDEIVKKVEALIIEAERHATEHFPRDSDRYASHDRIDSVRTDLLATIARHLSPAPPADEELRDAVIRLQYVRDYSGKFGGTYTIDARDAAAISTVLRAVQAPASGETDVGFEGALNALRDAALDAIGAYTDDRDIYDIKLDDAPQYIAARTAVIAEHNRAIAAAYEDAAKICARSVIAEGERE
jgi:hypothetical protein